MNISTAFFLTVIATASSLGLAQSLTETAPPLDQSASIIAEVLLNFDHSPTEEQEQHLKELMGNESESEAIRTLAAAVQSFEHAVHPDHIDKLESIRDNEYATAREKTLADVILELRHRPDAEQTARLAEID